MPVVPGSNPAAAAAFLISLASGQTEYTFSNPLFDQYCGSSTVQVWSKDDFPMSSECAKHRFSTCQGVLIAFPQNYVRIVQALIQDVLKALRIIYIGPMTQYPH